MNKGRSPLKNPPLRNPGETLEKEFDTVMDNKAEPYIFAAVISSVLAGMEWVRYWTHQPPHPIVLTLLAMLIVAGSWRKLRVVKGQLRNIAKGIQAEKSVGQYLEQFRADGYQIFHDIPGESGGKKFNLDHVLIGPKGIFTIETKYAHKPERGQAKIQYDGQQISINGHTPDRDPVVQAKAQARWLFEILKSSTGKGIFVKPVVIYPGWFVENKVFNADVWVIHEKALSTFIGNKNAELADSDVRLASFHLSRYIQSTLK